MEGAKVSDEILPQVFDNPEFGTIRVVKSESGEPLFLAKDICDFFGVTNRNRVLQQLDDDEKGGTQIDTPGGKQTMTYLTEAGLYHFLFIIQPSKARGVPQEAIDAKCKLVNRYKRWVTHDVLPSIRRNGGYMVARADETPEQLLARALKLADATLRERDARIASLTPRAEFYDATMKGERWMSVTEAARQLHQYDRSITRKDVFAFCMQRHIITSDKQASKLGIDRGYVANYQPPAYFDQTTGEMVRPKPYAKVTSKGFTWLLDGMCGQRRLQDAG